MKKPAVVLIAAAVIVPAIAAAETWSSVPLADRRCLEKVKAHPEEHATSCLINCSRGGYEVETADGTWLKLDQKGNQEALKALKATAKAKGIRVTVTGERSGDLIKVSTLTIE